VQIDTITGRDIIIVGQQPWDVTIGSNCKNIALELSKNNRVLYVNSAIDRITSIKRRNEAGIIRRKNVIKGQENGLMQIVDNLWTYYPDIVIESINWINNSWLFDVLNKRNNRLFANSILKALLALDFKHFILFNDNDMFKSFYLPELLKPRLSIYYSRDFMLGVDYWKKHGERIEPLLIKKSDLCVTNSTYLSNYCKKFNPNSYYIGQGCDFDVFSTSKDLPLIKEIVDMPGPKIGYVGALESQRLDIDLIAAIARERPSYNIILVGPEDEVFKKSILHSISNIYFFGSQSLEKLPQYINSFDVCINPQFLNPITIGNYPRKIDEYLAMEKPVVATLTEAVSIFKESIYLAESKDQFIQLIEKALTEDSVELARLRRKVALSHSWENSIKELYKSIIKSSK
jgi:glycosyltransferase involved in cell wall biosynthesis